MCELCWQIRLLLISSCILLLLTVNNMVQKHIVRLKLKVSESETKRVDAETSLREKDVVLQCLQAQHQALQLDNARLEGRFIAQHQALQLDNARLEARLIVSEKEKAE